MNKHFGRKGRCLIKQDRSPSKWSKIERQSEALPRQQARPEGEGTYSEDLGESKDDFSADEGERNASFENQHEKDADLVQLPRLGQEVNNPVSVSRPVES